MWLDKKTQLSRGENIDFYLLNKVLLLDSFRWTGIVHKVFSKVPWKEKDRILNPLRNINLLQGQCLVLLYLWQRIGYWEKLMVLMWGCNHLLSPFVLFGWGIKFLTFACQINLISHKVPDAFKLKCLNVHHQLNYSDPKKIKTWQCLPMCYGNDCSLNYYCKSTNFDKISNCCMLLQVCLALVVPAS